MRVLVADDMRTAADAVAQLCKRNRCEVFVCDGGSQVIPSLEWLRPDVLLLDIAMPDMYGLRVAEKLRERHGLRPPGLIAFTSYDVTVMRQMIVNAGFDHHLVKPVEWPVLSAAMMSALNCGCR
jgi:CheY-like chemotaxis protein